MFTRVIGEGVELRLMEERHVEEIYAVVERSRSHLRPWLLWADRTSVDQIRGFVRTALEQFASNDGFHAGIWVEGKYAGATGFHKIDWANLRVELGYWLEPEYEGRGLATLACRYLIEHAFREWKLNRVEIRCATGNGRSNAVPKRLNFTLDGTLRDGQLLYGQFHDLNVYSMLAREWTNITPSSNPQADAAPHSLLSPPNEALR